MSPAENIPSLLGLVPPWRIFLKWGLVLEKLLATVQAKAVPHVGAVKPEVPAGSCLFSSRNGWLGRGDCAIHSVMVVKGRRQGHRQSDVLHPAVPVELFASRWAREQLTHCWECSTFPKILWLHIQAYCWCCFKPGRAQAGEWDLPLRLENLNLETPDLPSSKEEISGKPRALQEIYQQRRNKWKNPSQEKNCSDATHSRNQPMLPVSAVLEPSWVHLLSNQEFKMTYENHDDPAGEKNTQRVVRLHILKFSSRPGAVNVCVCVCVHVRAQQTVVHFCTNKAVLRKGR